MAVFTKINSKDIKKIENIFNLGSINQVKGIKKGIENTNYIVKFNSTTFVLTIFEKRVKNKDLPFFMKLMSGLSNLNINCPRPIKTKKNSYLFNIKKKKACLVSFLQGNDKKNLTPKDCYILGKNIAILHRASKKLNLHRKNSLDVKSWSKLNKKIDKRINKLSKNFKNIIEENIYNIEKNWPKNLPKGVIHADLFIDNIFFFRKKFYGFIDFYFSSTDFYAYELATCINAICFKKKKSQYFLDLNKSSNLLKGYQKIRKLNSSEKNNFNILCKGSALRYLLTRSYDFLNTPKTALIKVKDPKEYFKKLIFHNNLYDFKNYIK